MTEIDFYVLSSDSPDARLDLVCRLAERAVHRAQAVFVHADELVLLQSLDERLWSFRPSSFVPHCLIADGHSPNRDDLDPVMLSTGEPTHDREVLINLAAEVPTFFSRFPRALEVIDRRESITAAGRNRYRFYQQRGYPLRHHTIQPQ